GLIRNSSSSWNYRREREALYKIFDPDDQELGLTLEQRQELIFASLTNPGIVGRSHRLDQSFDYSDREHFAKLWKLAAKWHVDSGVPYRVYRYIGVPDRALAEETIRTADQVILRALVLLCYKMDTSC